MMSLPEKFNFIHVATKDAFKAKKMEDDIYKVSWDGDYHGSTTYYAEEIIGYINDGDWEIIDEECDNCGDNCDGCEYLYSVDVSNDKNPIVSYGTVNISVELEDETVLAEGDSVVILAEVESVMFMSGKGYIIFSEFHCESATVDSSCITIQDEYLDNDVIIFDHNGYMEEFLQVAKHSNV